MENIGS